MNFIDVLLIIIVLRSAWIGWKRGFILDLFELVSWAGTLLVSLILYPDLAVILERHMAAIGMWPVPLAFVITIISVRIIFYFIIEGVLKGIPEKAHITLLNRILGILPGLINGLVYAAIVATLLLVVPFSDTLTTTTGDSKFANRLTNRVEWLQERLSPVLEKLVINTKKKEIKPGSDELIKLPFKVNYAKPRPDLEAEMLILINKERIKFKLKPLKSDPPMTKVARMHSQDMFVKSYFSHVSPDGKDPFDRMRKGGITYMSAGENLALAQTLIIAHNGLMNSPGHRANILNKKFRRVGIGVLDGGIYGLMITQGFRN